LIGLLAFYFSVVLIDCVRLYLDFILKGYFFTRIRMGQNQVKFDPAKSAHRVVDVKPNSPASDCGLDLDDYILKVNNRRLMEMDTPQIMQLVQRSENQVLNLLVFNSRECRMREVNLIPSKRWSGPGLLGVTIRLVVVDAQMYEKEEVPTPNNSQKHNSAVKMHENPLRKKSTLIVPRLSLAETGEAGHLSDIITTTSSEDNV